MRLKIQSQLCLAAVTEPVVGRVLILASPLSQFSSPHSFSKTVDWFS